MLPWRRGIVLVLGLSGLSSIAYGADQRAARTAFEKGKIFFQQKAYERALPHFREAYELSSQRPSTILALAQCERALGLWDDAINHFREYLRADPPDRERVEATLAVVRAERAREAGASNPNNKLSEDSSPRLPDTSEALRSRPGSSTYEAESSDSSKSSVPGSGAAEDPRLEPTLSESSEAKTEKKPRSWLEEPWFWVAAGAAVAVGATVATAAALSNQSSDPYSGTAGVILTP